MWLLVDILGWNGSIVKLAVSVFVVIVNYVASKLLVFQEKVKNRSFGAGFLDMFTNRLEKPDIAVL